MTSQTKPIVRKAIGAGKWFPARKQILAEMIDGFVDNGRTPPVQGRIVSAIAPHAGYAYSGKVAGFVFSALKENAIGSNAPETVVLLGFSHSEGFSGAAIMDGDSFSTPLTSTLLDSDAAAILSEGRDRIHISYGPHPGEHSAENEIPFVQATLPAAKLVVILTGDHDPRTLDQLLAGLNELASTKQILVVASSDMLHDADYDLVSTTDRETLKSVRSLNYNQVTDNWAMNRQIFCGLMPTITAMRFAESQGCTNGHVLHYRNSGDDHPSSRGQWVVGYGAVVFATTQ